MGIALGVVLAVVAGAVLTATNVLHWGHAADTTPAHGRQVSLPATLAGLRDPISVAKARGANAAELANQQRTATHLQTLTEKAYQAAYAGAPVAFARYADASMQFLPAVVAIGAPSPGLTTGPVSDPADLGLAVPERQITQDQNVQCLVANEPPATAGQQQNPDDQVTTECMRTDQHVTVLVFGLGKSTAGHSQMVQFTNAAFEWVATR